MTKRLVVDQIEITSGNALQIRFHKLSGDGDLLGYHRTAILPDGDIDTQLTAVNQHMGGEGYDAIPVADIARIKTISQAVWGA